MQDGQQPGWVFKPGEQPQPPQSTYAESPLPAPGVAYQTVPSEQQAPVTQQNVPLQVPIDTGQPDAYNDMTSTGSHVEWTASEYIANPKSAGWFGLLALGSILLAGLIFLISRDIISTVVVLVVAILFGIFAARQPRTLNYAVNNMGIQAGVKFYPYTMFKSFSQSRDRAVSYISLLPLRRFMPPLVIHYAPEDEERILNTLADYLPYEDHHADIMDSITKKIKF